MDTEILLPNMTYTVQITGCQFSIKPPGWRYPRHHHHLFELLYCQSGEVTQSIEGTEIILKAGELVMLRPGIKHHMHNHANKPYRFFNIHFNIDDHELRALFTTQSCEHLNEEQVKQTKLLGYIDALEQLLQQELKKSNRSRDQIERKETENSSHIIFNESKEQIHLHMGGIDKLLFHNQVLLMINEVALVLHQRSFAITSKLATDNEGSGGAGSGSSRIQVDVAHEIEEMLRNSTQGVGAVNAIARQKNLSRSQCYKIFTQVYGMSPRQYLSQIKLNQAKQELLANDLSIETIAAKLGFSSVSHFSRQFKRWTGVSPNQYRPKHEGTYDSHKGK